MRNGGLALLAAALLAWPTGARAGIVVLHGPDVDAAQASILAKDQLGTGDLRVAGPLSEWIGVAPEAAVVVGARVTACKEDGQDKRGLGGSMVPLRDQMMEMSYDSAILRSRLLVDRLPCLAEGATTDDLYELLFTRAIAHFFAGEEAAAQHGFAAAAAIDPARDWPKRYPPKPKSLYLDALRDVVAEPPAPVLNEITSGALLDGAPITPNTRLHKGGHLLWVEESGTALWLELDSPAALGDEGLLVTTAANLQDGLLTGDSRYKRWLVDLAEAQGWTEVALVSEGWTILLKDGELEIVKADVRALRRAEAELRRSKGIHPMTAVGIALAGGGVAVAGVGTGVNMSTYRDGIPQVGEPLLGRTDYEALQGQNQAGMGLAIGGGAAALTGVVVSLVGLAMPAPKVVAMPYLQHDGETTTFGLAGRFP